jgi:hypothetical protein
MHLSSGRPKTDRRRPTVDDFMTELSISTCARTTWIWARDEEIARRVRKALDDAGRFWEIAISGPTQLPLVTDVEIGVDAYEACWVLSKAGFVFSWHKDQNILNRDGWPEELPGIAFRAGGGRRCDGRPDTT